MIDHYILLPNHTLAKADLMTWAEWYQTDPTARRVAETETEFFWVSTVFLGVNYNWSPSGPPIVFETMVFDRQSTIKPLFGRLARVHESQDCWRYSTWDDAITGHDAAVRRIQKLEADSKALSDEMGEKQP